MSTVTRQGKGAKGLKVIGLAVTALVIGAWILPSRAQMERAPVGPVHTEAEIAADVNADSDWSVWISFPATLQEWAVLRGVCYRVGRHTALPLRLGRSGRDLGRSVGVRPDRRWLLLRRRLLGSDGRRCRQGYGS